MHISRKQGQEKLSLDNISASPLHKCDLIDDGTPYLDDKQIAFAPLYGVKNFIKLLFMIA